MVDVYTYKAAHSFACFSKKTNPSKQFIAAIRNAVCFRGKLAGLKEECSNCSDIWIKDKEKY